MKQTKIFYHKAEPTIYIRMFLGVIMYIGETKDWKSGRPFRESDDPKITNSEFISKFIEKNPYTTKKPERTLTKVVVRNSDKDYKKNVIKFVEKNPDRGFDPYEYSIGNWDQVRMLPASCDSKRRKYGEAVLITKYKPLTQTATIFKYYTIIKKNINITEMLKDNTQKQKESVMKMRENNNKKLERHYKFQILEGMNNLITLKKEKKDYEQKNS